MKYKGSKILLEQLVKHKVKSVFGYPGGAVLNIYDELYRYQDKITHYITAHEQGAAHAADGFARATGEVGVVIATSGPGATNLVTGIANAYLDSIPMVAITGNVTSNLLGKDSFQEVDIVGITMPIVKYNYSVRSINDLEQIIEDAFYIAKEGRPGPVLIDIPKDIQIAECEYKGNLQPTPIKKFKENISEIDDVIEAINSSKRPYIYSGGGVVISDAGDLVVELSKRIGAPIGTSLMGLSAIPQSYEDNLGITGMHGHYSASVIKAESDLIIAIGVRFSDRATGDKEEYINQKKIIHLDIDMVELNKNIIADLCLKGDAKRILNQLIYKTNQDERQEWREIINEHKAKQEDYNSDIKKFYPYQIISTVAKNFSANTVVATDVGQHQMWTAQYYPFNKTRKFLTSGGLGTMGFGMGAAIGGCIGNNFEDTVLFTGDGSFGMNLNELITAVSYQLPLTIVIINNEVLGMVRQWQAAFYDHRYSQTTLNRKTNFTKMAESFGAKGYRVESIKQLEEILKKRKNIKGPIVLDCIIDKDEKVLPMIPPGGSVKNMIIN